MTALDTLRAHRVGLWTSALELLPYPAYVEAVQEIEGAGWPSLWFAEAYGREAFTQAQVVLAHTRRLVAATGIASIYGRGPMAANAAARLVEAAAPGRFVLGLGVSHQPLVERDRGESYGPPLASMRRYLDGLDSSPYVGGDAERPPVVLAALGPKMLALAGERTAGAHTYNVTPEHTATAREALGHEPLLCVEQAVVLDDRDADEVRRRSHEHLNAYTGLPNYRSAWARLGFDPQTDFVRGGSDRLKAAIVAAGEDAIRRRVDEHLAAGADHVAVQVLGPDLFTPAREDWRRLAEVLL